jgi:putative endonuclease
MNTTYILLCADNTLYIGSTSNIEKRLHAHNHLKSGAHYTKTRRPVNLVYKETFETASEAKKREAKLKRLTRAEKLALFTVKKVL